MKSFTAALAVGLLFACSSNAGQCADQEPAKAAPEKPAAEKSTDQPTTEKPNPADPKSPIKLTLTARGAARPVLKHLLLPPLTIRRPGNAAVLYNKA